MELPLCMSFVYFNSFCRELLPFKTIVDTEPFAGDKLRRHPPIYLRVLVSSGSRYQIKAVSLIDEHDENAVRT